MLAVRPQVPAAHDAREGRLRGEGAGVAEGLGHALPQEVVRAEHLHEPEGEGAQGRRATALGLRVGQELEGRHASTGCRAMVLACWAPRGSASRPSARVSTASARTPSSRVGPRPNSGT